MVILNPKSAFGDRLQFLAAQPLRLGSLNMDADPFASLLNPAPENQLTLAGLDPVFSEVESSLNDLENKQIEVLESLRSNAETKTICSRTEIWPPHEYVCACMTKF